MAALWGCIREFQAKPEKQPQLTQCEVDLQR
jgi:hypothetical protein